MPADPAQANLRADTVARLESLFRDEGSGVVAAYLFGSVARGEAVAGSDADVGVLLEKDPPSTLEGMAFDLQDRLALALGRPVDLVVMNRAPVDVVKRILRDGVLVADRDPSRRIAFEVRARNEYWDLLPILRRYRRQPATRP